jgi:hypothetical protein
VETYRHQAGDIIRRFHQRGLSFSDCISALDAAFARLMPELTGDQIVPLRSLMLANNEIVMKEMERRGPRKKRQSSPQP